jgi:hypothetical protein
LNGPLSTRTGFPPGDEQHGHVPCYLFRVYTEDSDGHTDGDWVMSRDHVEGNHHTPTITPNVLESATTPPPPKETARLIRGRLKWQHLEKDNLMSWTSSLLFAIQYVFHKHAFSRGSLAFEDINILVVDTAGFPADSFIRDMDLINAYCTYDAELENFRNLRTEKLRGGEEFYFGEFLSQGALAIGGSDGGGRRSKIVSARSMIDARLLELRFAFQQSHDDPKEGWPRKVLELRADFITNPPSRTVSRRRIGLACETGRLFGREFRLPVAIQLAAICPGRLAVNTVALAFEGKGFDGKPHTYIQLLLSLSDRRTDHSLTVPLFTDDELSACAAESSEMMQSPKLPELERARLIADMIYASYCHNKVQGA